MPEVFNAAAWLAARHVSDGAGSRTAVLTAGRTVSYDELAAEVRRVAAGLRAIGVRPEERVMLCMADGLELLTGILGAMYAGAVAVPVSTMVTGAELAAAATDSRARVLCLSTELDYAERDVVARCPEVTDVIVDGGTSFDAPAGVTVRTWAEFVSAGEPDGTDLPPYESWPDSPALWLYTSGTTGQPKAAMHRHGSIRNVAECYGAEVLGVRPDDRCLSVAKLFFAYGLGNSAFFPLAAGGAVILEPRRPTPEVMAGRARADRPTLFFGVPTFYAALLASDVPDDSFGSVRQAVSAGEALPAALFERFRDRFGVEILDGLGSTEALHIFVSGRPGSVTPGSSGTAVPGYDVEIRDALGAVIPEAGRPGDLFVRGASVATGYWCRTEATRQVFRGEWLRTGDTYVRNEDGTLSCLGRSGDMLKAGGIWVSPAEVEARLLAHPDVAEVAVVAAVDGDGLEKPVACVVPRPGQQVDPAGLIAFCRAGLAAFKRPRAVVEMTALPKTATGKVRRNVLRDLVADVLRRPAPAESQPHRSGV